MARDCLVFGDCADRVGVTVRPDELAGVPYVGLEHIAPQTLHLAGVGRPDDINSAKSAFQRGDILFGKLRPYFRKVLLAPFGGVCSTDIWVIRARRGVDQRFVHYWMASPDFIEHAVRGSDGTKMPRAKWEFVAQHRIPILSERKQRAIAHILGTLDDKIEQNRRICETLEAMARAVFKSWFVDFDPVCARAKGRTPSGMDADTAKLFPSEFAESELGEIPKGWRVGSIADVATNRRDTIHPRDVTPDSVYVGLEHLPRGRLFFEETGRPDALESLKAKFSAGEVLFGKLRPYFKKVAVTPCTGICSTDVLVLSPRAKATAFVALLAASNPFIEHAVALSNGTRMPRTNWEQLTRFLVVVPPKDVLEAFDNWGTILFRRAEAARQESGTLAQLRDELLPRLLSGALSVAHAEHAIEEVA